MSPPLDSRDNDRHIAAIRGAPSAPAGALLAAQRLSLVAAQLLEHQRPDPPAGLRSVEDLVRDAHHQLVALAPDSVFLEECPQHAIALRDIGFAPPRRSAPPRDDPTPTGTRPRPHTRPERRDDA